MIEIIQHIFGNWDDVLAGAVLWSIIGHMVNTFPTPENKYASWFLSTIQYAVGQRDRAKSNGNGTTGTFQVRLK